jgi:hypothetical protein
MVKNISKYFSSWTLFYNYVKTGTTFNLLFLFSVCLKNYVQGASPQFLIPKYASDEIFENISFIQIEFLKFS